MFVVDEAVEMTQDRRMKDGAAGTQTAVDHGPEARGPVQDLVSRTSDDALLAGRIVAGDEHAFELLMRRHNQLLFRSARAIVRDDAEAEDVVQEAYMKAFAAMGRFEGRSSLGTWLVRIVVNEARTRLRRSARIVPLAAVADMGGDVIDEQGDACGDSNLCLEHSSRGPEDAAGDSELRNALSEAVDRLPEALRTVFVLRCVEGMSVAETCACLDVTPEVVRTRLHRARAMLRRDIDRSLTREARRLFSFGHERCDRIVSVVLERIRAGLGGDT